jgi:uncharacterized protein
VVRQASAVSTNPPAQSVPGDAAPTGLSSAPVAPYPAEPTPPTVAYSGPVAVSERFIAPDLLRGVALLGIALANAVYYIGGRVIGPLGRPVDGSTGDHVADVVIGTFVDNRAFPLFTLLFAYGFTVLVRRQAERGVDRRRARSLLLRRSLWLLVFGALHVVLLFEGDILFSYGALGLVLAAMFAASDRVFRVVGWSTLAVFALASGSDGLGGGAGDLSWLPFDQTTLLGDLAWRVLALIAFVFSAPLTVAMLLPIAALGTLLGRRRVLEHPEQHVVLLRRLTLVGFPISILGALPLVLAAIDAWAPGPITLYALGVLHGTTGVAGALAFFGLVGWWAAGRAGRVSSGARPGVVLSALLAVGRRSLTCYLLQSVLFVVLLKPWALGLGVEAGTLRMALVAVGVWLVTVLVAVVLDRTATPGPAERLLRRLSYGR